MTESARSSKEHTLSEPLSKKEEAMPTEPGGTKPPTVAQIEAPVTLERVVHDELKFKAKLAIGENAYAELRTANAVRKYWDLIGAVGGGAGLAKAGFLGLAMASSPVGWIVAATVSGGAWFAVMRTLSGATEGRVTVIPKFINTPLDVLGSTLFGLMMPLALKVAAADGHVVEKERLCIRNYFVDQWGFDAQFVEASMVLMEPQLSTCKIATLATELVAYKKSNPDCNYAVMSRDLLAFLTEVMESDGVADEREELVLKRVESIFAETERIALGNTVSVLTAAVAGKARVGAQAVASGAQAAGAIAVSKVEAIGKSEAFGQLKEGAEKGATMASNSIHSAVDKAVRMAKGWSDKRKK